ncbi:MAG: co-chaperone DjlA [Deltaproteobacteria bacterium]|nr:co-chaperone DjlA [Deltaproteobacteria bacterium]
MSWWGKFIGGSVGFFFGGPLGAILGTAVGHSFDKARAVGTGGVHFGYGDNERVQMAFFTATFSVMGHLAKADGRVSNEEIAAVRKIMTHMRLTAEQQQTAINLFDEGKRPDFPLDDILEQFRRECHRRSTLTQMFLEILLGAAMADGKIHDSELRILYHVCERVGYPREQFERIVRMMQAGQKAGGTTGFDRAYGGAADNARLKDAYGVLGLSEKAPDEDVKKSYRRLMTQYHPDKLVSKGLPDEMMQFATEKTRNIKAAYELIRESRRLH